MKTATEVRRQLRAICVQQQLQLQSSGHDTTSIRLNITLFLSFVKLNIVLLPLTGKTGIITY